MGAKPVLKFTKLAVTIAAAGLCLGLSAQDARAAYSCSDATYGSGSGTYNSSYATCSTNNTANQNGTTTTATAVLRVAATQTAGLIGNRVSGALGGGSGFNVASNGFSAQTGMSAGNAGNRAGAWVSGSWTDVEDDNTDTAFEGDVYTLVGGMDYKVTAQTVIGLAVGYEDVDIDTEYNDHPTTGTNGSLEGDGWTVAPYIGVELGDNAHADLTLGYSDLEYDTVRFDPNTGNRIVGSTDGERYFVNAAVSGSHMFDQNWHLHGKGAIFYATEEKDDFTETESNGATIAQNGEDSDLGQFLLDARLGYLFDYVEPYALVGLEFDFAKDDAPVAAGQTASLEDDFGAKFGGGLNLRLGSNVTGGIEAYTVEFRDDYNEYTFTGGLRVDF